MPTMTREGMRERDAELCAVIEQQQEQLRAVLAHVEELRAENKQLKAYAKHERSLGAEGPMIELVSARQEITRLNELFALKWDATQSAETKAVHADNERLKAAIAYVRQRSQPACEILNEFDNTRTS